MRIALVSLVVVGCASAKPAPPLEAPSPSPSASVSSVAPAAPVFAGKAIAPSRPQSNFRNTCFLKSTGQVVCWGTGAVHEMATYGKPLPAPLRPVTIAGIDDATQIAVTSHSACALRKNGELWCWGGDKAIGGATIERQKAKAVSGLKGIVRIFGGDSICAFESEGQLACLDQTSVRRTKLPVPVSEIVDVSGGRDHACLASSRGEVFCWGRNDLGELGGVAAANDPFVRVPKVDTAVSVLAGDGFSCALLAAGTMSCWGNGHDIPGGYEGGKYPVVTTKDPVPYVRLASGMHFRCDLTNDAKVECSGDNKHGQLGNGTTDNAYSMKAVLGLTDAIAVAVGFDHACAAKADDTVFCWGANDAAQIGDGTLGDRRFATKVLGLGGSEPPPPPKPGSGPPIVVPMAKSAIASWREPDAGLFRSIGSRRWTHYDQAPDAVGMKVALFKSRSLLLDEAHGLVPVTFPANATWFGLDGNDAIYAGTKDSLMRADDVDGAKKNAWKKVLAVPYAVDFGTTKGLVVAAQAKTLHVSTDGKSFVAKNLKIDLSIEEVFVRPDVVGVVGHDASGDSTLYLSKDQGSSFTKSSFQADRFSQSGSLIWASGCPGAVLSADGLTWRKREDYGYTSSSFGGWGGALRLGVEPHAFFSDKLANLVEPPPPPVPTGAEVATGKPGKCGAGGVGMIGGGGRYRNPGACIGVECVRGSIGEEAKSTKTEVGFFADGLCARDEKGWCKKDAPWVRAPHVSVGGTMLEVPAGCDPDRVLSAGGIGVLFCAKSKGDFDLHTIDKSGKWNAEGTVSFAAPIDDVTVATDGTMVVHPICPVKGKETESCAPALVRKPVALGTSGAWRSTTTARALSYRVLTGGEVLVIAQTAANDVTKFDLVIEKPAGKSVLTSATGVADDLIDLVIETDRIVVTQRMTARPLTKWYVAKDGVVPIVEEPKKPAEPTPKKKKPIF